MSKPNFYQILEIPTNASMEQIKQAFKHHFEKYRNLPSKTLVDNEKILQIKEAYDVLSNPSAKVEYDQNLLDKKQEALPEITTQKTSAKTKKLQQIQEQMQELKEFEAKILQTYAISEEKYSQAGAWTRFVARSLDFMLCFITVALVIIFALPELYLLIDELGKFDSVIYGLLAFGLDALIYLIFKNTPFKAMLDIHLLDKNGEQISRTKYLFRNCRVFFEGFGLCFVFATLGMYVWQYKHLKKHGSTSYDLSSQTVVISSHPKFMIAFAWFLYALLNASIIALIIYFPQLEA